MSDRTYPARSVWVRALNLMVRLAPLRSKYYFNSILLRKRLSESQETPVGNGCRFGWATPEDIRAIATHTEALDEDVYAGRVANGDGCLCAKLGNEIVSYNWIRFTSCCVLCGFHREIGFLPLEPGQAFTYDFYTYSKYRRKHIGSSLKVFLLGALKQRGIQEVCTLVRPHNEISMKIQLRLGYEPVQMFYGYQLAGWKKVFSASACDRRRMKQWVQRFRSERGLG
jgi:ribosomal protein S18 acetylase RimI-like enzyme